MQVIVDTSVWSLALRRGKPQEVLHVNALRELISEGRVVMIGAVRQEILSGVRYTKQFERLDHALRAFPDEHMETSDYVEAARISNECMTAGVSTGNTDCLISAFSINRGYQVLTTDNDFLDMSGVIPGLEILTPS